jgi:hypothetical protein
MLRAVPKFSTLAAAGSGMRGASEAKRADALAKMNAVIGDNGKTMTSPQGQITDPKRGLAYFAHNRLFSKSATTMNIGLPAANAPRSGSIIPSSSSMQNRSVVSKRTYDQLRKAIPREITVAPDVPVVQSGGACDAYATKVLKGYAAQVSPQAKDSVEEMPKSLLERLKIKFEGRKDTDSDRPQSGDQLLQRYYDNGAFIISGAGLANDYARHGYANHSMPVTAVAKVEIDGEEKVFLVALDRSDDPRGEHMKIIEDLARELGIKNVARMTQSVLNQHQDLKEEVDRLSIRLMEADPTIKHTNEKDEHYETLGLYIPRPHIEYLKEGIKPISPEQEEQLKAAIVDAYRKGDVETYKDVDYSTYAQYNKDKIPWYLR